MKLRDILVIFALTIGLAPSAVLAVGYETSGRGAFFESPKSKVKKFPTLRATTAVPATVDPETVESLPFTCEVSVRKGSDGDVVVKKAKGRYTASLFVLDALTSTFRSFDAGSGTFKTRTDGTAAFSLSVSAQSLSPAFASGDELAWVAVEVAFTNGKKATTVAVVCSSAFGQGTTFDADGEFFILAPVDKPDVGLEVVREPGLSGISFRFSWKELEPADGVYDFAPVIDALDAAEAADRDTMLRFHAGTNTPEWLFPMVEMTTFQGGDPHPIPWDPVYLERWHAFLERAGDAVGRRPRLKMVHLALTGPGSELQAPREVAEVRGVDELIRDAYASTFEVYEAAFPDAAISLNVAKVFLEDETLHQVLSDDFRAELGPERAALQVNILRETTNTSRTPWPTITKAAAEGALCGTQMGIIEISEQDFELSISKARDVGCAQWVEIYKPQVPYVADL